jgi:hypothetical protein
MSASFLGTDKVISGADDRNVKVWDVSHLAQHIIPYAPTSPPISYLMDLSDPYLTVT